MKKKKKLKIIIPIVIVAIILIFTALVFGINYYMNNIYEGSNTYITLSSNFTDVIVTDENSAIKAVKSAANELGITDEKNDLSVTNFTETNSGATYLIQQYYDNYPVYNATAVLCIDKKGNVTELKSQFKKIKKYSKPKYTLSSDEILNKLDLDSNNLHIGTEKVKSFMKDKTIYLYQCSNGKFIPVYFVHFLATTYIVRVDGKIIEYKDNLMSDSYAKCYNSDGSREFNGYYITDNDNYTAYDSERNITIWTLQKKYNSKNKLEKAEELISNDEYFGNTENEKKKEYDTAVVFMNNISKIYDYYNDTFSEKAYGELLLCYNDARDKGNNGFGGEAEESGRNIGTLFIGYNKDANDIDLLAHEYTHIVTSNKIKWVDNAEEWENEEDYEGALKEAYSDIFGEIITSKISGEEPDWIHGDRIIYDPMSNNYPANINDKEWKFNLLQWTANGFKQGYGMDIGGGTSTDYAHGFSTVISHSAYLMWNGIDGNESKKIDIDTLSEIWYNSLNIISENQDNKGDNLTAVTFDDCVNAVLTSGKKLLKNDSITEKQYNCIIEAFNQVGILNENNLVDGNVKEDKKQTDNVDYEKIYYQYIKDNFNVFDTSKYPAEILNQQNNDVVEGLLFSALIKDFDNDGKKELVTFFYSYNQEYIFLQLYSVINGKVTVCDVSDKIDIDGVGDFGNIMCGTFDGKDIRIQYNRWSYGGSCSDIVYTSFEVYNNKFILKDYYFIYEFNANERYIYEEKVNNTKYSSLEEINKCIVKAGYDINSHIHNEYSNSDFDFIQNGNYYLNSDSFKGNHIFTILSDTSIGYGFTYDNTNLISILNNK